MLRPYTTAWLAPLWPQLLLDRILHLFVGSFTFCAIQAGHFLCKSYINFADNEYIEPGFQGQGG